VDETKKRFANPRKQRRRQQAGARDNPDVKWGKGRSDAEHCPFKKEREIKTKKNWGDIGSMEVLVMRSSGLRQSFPSKGGRTQVFKKTWKCCTGLKKAKAGVRVDRDNRN